MHSKHSILISAAVFVAIAAPALAQSNTSESNRFSWNENYGWMNWRGANSSLQGVRHNGRFLSGFIWANSIGWINTGNGVTPPATQYIARSSQTGQNFGVNIDSTTNALSGFAWSEIVGWINFGSGPSPSRIDSSGRLNGYAYSENAGWINLAVAAAGQFVALCYANCDGSETAPVLTANDFQCFLNAFATGNPYANCDTSIVTPVLTANDFQCFLNAYAAWCP